MSYTSGASLMALLTLPICAARRCSCTPRARDFEVAREAADGVRGLAVARKAHIMALLLDAVLNRMSGDELNELRWQANLPQAEFGAQLGVADHLRMECGRRPVTAAAALLARTAASRAARA